MTDGRQSLKGIIVWGIITTDLKLITEVENKIAPNFGQVILKSPITSFDFTNYYEEEMGKNLKRCWLVTEKPISLERLAEIKLCAIQTEKMFTNEGNQRRVNIDPGFLTLSNFVLATTKNYGHRIYLKDGIFAEVTLIYRNKSFQVLDWTYPDYRHNIDFFNNVRKNYSELQYKSK